MVLGETEILRQVRQAMDRALEQHTAGPVLAALFRQAVAVGKRVRTETPIARRPASISAAVATIAESVIGPLAGRIILIIGAGHMGTLITKALIKKGARRERMTIASRTYCRARQLAEREGAMAIPLPEVATVLKDADLIVTCTSAPHPILSAADLQRALSQRQGHTMCIIDVAVPRNVDPAAAHVPGANLYDIDDLQGIVSRGREERESALPAAEAIIADAVQDFMAWYDSRRMVPILTALRKKAERIRQQEVDKALGRLGHLSERDRQVVIACSLAITNKLLHDPIMSLKDNAHQDANGTYADIACRLFGLDQLDQSAVEGDPTREHAAATTVRG
jgi:glutamyl-tRNA reductase